MNIDDASTRGSIAWAFSWTTALAGGLARSAAELSVLPYVTSDIDRRVNKREQLQLTNLIRIAAQDGVAALFTGARTTLRGCAIEGALLFQTYDWARQRCSEFAALNRQSCTLLSGLASATASYLVHAATIHVRRLQIEDTVRAREAARLSQYAQQRALGLKEFAQDASLRAGEALSFRQYRNYVYKMAISFFCYEELTRRVYQKHLKESMRYYEQVFVAFFSGYAGGAFYSIYHYYFFEGHLRSFARGSIGWLKFLNLDVVTVFKYSNYSGLQWMVYQVVRDQLQNAPRTTTYF